MTFNFLINSNVRVLLRLKRDGKNARFILFLVIVKPLKSIDNYDHNKKNREKNKIPFKEIKFHDFSQSNKF